MYFKVTNGISEAAISGDRHCLELLRLLNMAILLGKHIVFAPRTVLKSICENIETNIDGFKYVYHNYASIGAITDTLDWHAEFVIGSILSYKDVETRTIYINVNDIPRFEPYKETHLLCENMSDVAIYTSVLNYYKKLYRLETPSCFYSILGGGSSTYRVYEHEIKSRKAFVLCLTDGDQRFPNGAHGDTCKHVEKVERDNKSFTSYCYHLSSLSEIENVVPLVIYEEYCTKVNPQKAKDFEKIKELYSKDNSSLDYFDFKRGITLHSIESENVPQNNLVRLVQMINPTIMDDINTDKNGIEKLKVNIIEQGIFNSSSEINEIIKSYRKKKVYVCGLGDKILENVIDTCRLQLSMLKPEQLSLAQQNEYEIVGKLIYNWTCCLGELWS